MSMLLYGLCFLLIISDVVVVVIDGFSFLQHCSQYHHTSTRTRTRTKTATGTAHTSVNIINHFIHRDRHRWISSINSYDINSNSVDDNDTNVDDSITNTGMDMDIDHRNNNNNNNNDAHEYNDDEEDNDDDDNDEIETSFLPLLQIASAHCASQALHAAIQLNLPDILAGDYNGDSANGANANGNDNSGNTKILYSIDELSEAISSSSTKSTSTSGKKKKNTNTKCNKDALLRTMRLLTTIDIVQETTRKRQQQQRSSSSNIDIDIDNDENEYSIYCFSLTKLGKCLTSNYNNNKGDGTRSPNMTSLFQHWMEQPLWDSWLSLSDYIQDSGDSNDDDDDDDDENNKSQLPFERANNGVSSDNYYNQQDHPVSLHHANEFVQFIYTQELNAIVHQFDWSFLRPDCDGSGSGTSSRKRKKLVDIGGNNGVVVSAIANKEPTIDCYCYDLPEVINRYNSTSSSSSTTTNKAASSSSFNPITMIPGNVLDTNPSTIPSDCDAIFMKHFLDRCMWNEKETIQILQACSKALITNDNNNNENNDTTTCTNGRIIIADAVLPDVGYQNNNNNINTTNNDNNNINNTNTTTNSNNELSLHLDALYMLVGRQRQRTKQEWTKLAKAANLTIVQVQYTTIPSCSIIVLEKEKK